MIENINVCIIGKPNVGKSTIFNKILGSNISEVSEISGTTIYPVTSLKEYGDININLIDLGGLKRKSKSHGKTQKLITNETIKDLIPALKNLQSINLTGSTQIKH